MVATLSFCAEARVLVSPEAALREAFPGATAERRTDYLTDAQAKRIEEIAGTAPSSRIVVSYTAKKAGVLEGTATLDTHIVRTEPETILVVLGPEGKIRKVEILSFNEPDEYRPREKWLDQFGGRTLDPDLSLRGSIRGVTGATLSARALTAAVRRVLATRQVLVEKNEGASRPNPQRPAEPAAPETPGNPAPGSPPPSPPVQKP